MKGDTGFPVRLQYTKLGKIRFLGHRDVARALERAFRVARLPLAFSEGFSPHPKVSFGLALSTGHESEAEYVDLELSEPLAVDALPGVLTPALPDGIAVVGAAALVERAPALQEAVTSCAWLVEVARPDGSPVDRDEIREQAETVSALPEIMVTKRRKGREVTEDIRPVIRQLTVCDTAPVTLKMELRTQPRSARPGEVLAAFGELSEVRALRTHQWIERDGARLEPLDADTRPRVPEARAS